MKDKEHFYHLKDLIRLEETEENEQIREEILQLSAEERQLRGKALLGLFLEEKHFSPAGHNLLSFSLKDKQEFPLFTLEPGDLVSIFPKGIRIDEIPSGTVYEKTKDTITVALSEPWPDWVENGISYELHRSVNRVTYKRMLESIDAVLETQNTRLAFFRDLSLGLKKTEYNEVRAKDIVWQDPGLNESQKNAVFCALSVRDIGLVHGPPGTGKTTVLVEIIRQTLLQKKSVFVTAPSNTACDNMVERLLASGIQVLRLGHPARITPALREHTLDFKLALHPLARNIEVKQAELFRLFKKEDRYRDRRSPGHEAEKEIRSEISFLKQEIKNMRKEVYERVIKETEVFVATPAGVQDKAIRDKVFDLVVIDEATQATEPISWIPIIRAKKVIMAGDHFQLPPTVRSQEAEDGGLGVSLFERFYEVLPEGCKALLTRQYRMHEHIMNFSSKIFYKSLLVADDTVKKAVLADLPAVTRCPETEEPIVYIDTAGKGFEEKLETGSESRYNPEEADLVLSILAKMLRLGIPASEIAVINAYSAQVRLLSSRSPDPAVEIDSVDGFQGREKELVIVSLVRSNMQGEMGFLADTRRMNVAMTRAKKKLVVIGDSATLATLAFYKSFIEYAESVGGYRTVWEIEDAP